MGRGDRSFAGRCKGYFYPKDDQGRKIDTYLPVKGGEVKVPPGHYSAVIYNYDTEVVQVKDEGSYETIMACTGNCTGLGISETENMVWGPDAFYMLSLNDVEVGKENELPMLEVKLKAVVTTYTFAIKTEGLKMSPPSLAVFPEWQNVITWVKMQVYAALLPFIAKPAKETES